MAIVFMDGFDHYGTEATGANNMLRGQWSSLSGNIFDPTYPVSSIRRSGSNSLRVTGNARFSLRGEKLVVGQAFGLYIPTLPIDVGYVDGICFYNQAGNGIIDVTIMPDGALRIISGSPTNSNSNLIEITDTAIIPGSFIHLEIKLVIDNTVGSIEIRVNGIILTQIGTLNLGSSGCASIAWHTSVLGNSGPFMYIDDVITWDDNGDFFNDFVGPLRLITDFAEADTAQADWIVNGAASGVDAINEVPPNGDTSYLGSDTVGDISEFTMPTLPSELATIAGIFVPVMARSDEAGISSVRVSMVSNGQAFDGVDHALSPQYVYYRDSYEYDPDNEEAWTKESFEAALIRIEKVA